MANKIKFNNGKLKIMHITDTHLNDDIIDMSVWLIAQACDREKPDIVTVTGDNVNNHDNPEITKSYISKLMEVFETRKIPAAITFGNHDSEVGALSRKELMDCYNSYSCSLSNDDTSPECGTYNIPVMSSDNSEIKFNLWMFDSGDYDGDGHYGCVTKKLVDWYKNTSDTLTKENNGQKVYSLAFQHIIVPEVYDALKKVKKKKLFSFSHMYNENDFYIFDPDTVNFGTFNETPCCGYENYGQFEAMVEKGDVLAIFSGHDHTNAFGVKHKGIDIVNSLSTRYTGDEFSTQYGYRIIEVDENCTSTYTSRVEHWFNMFSFKDVLSFKSGSNDFAYKTAFRVKMLGLLQKFYTQGGRLGASILTGRKITYKD